ncbi:MAG: hypothetical protein JWL77_3402 [Chthonomonadaceae bacterium]|nr:hypothetical protein [Chthonomonadaceae bacterium]
MNLCHNVAGRAWGLFVCGAFLIGSGRQVDAQSHKRPAAVPVPRQERNDPPGGVGTGGDMTIPMRELGETVVIVPWNYKNSRDSAVQSAHEVCSQLLLGTGFNVFLIKSATGAMPPPMSGISGSKKQESAFANLVTQGRNMVTQDAPNKGNTVFVLPTTEEMIAIGERLHSRFVLAGRAQWRSRDVWIGVSNRIKSICTVDVRILDVNTRHLVLDAHGVEGDSTENKNLYNSFANLMALNPLPLVMPGSIGPYEQRAVAVAITRAMHPWLKTERIRAALAQAETSSEAATGGDPPARFTDLLSPVQDLQVDLHVMTPNGKAPDVGDKDLNRLYALHDVTLEYKESNQLRLTANAPKDGAETLLVNDDQRSFAVGQGKKVSHQDLSSSPAKRSFLFEFCGVLTTDIFDTMRARYVKQEPVEDVHTLVYDLTYWGLDDSPYHRIWIDPDRRLIVKRESFGADSKLKRITLYKQPTQVGTNLWFPGLAELQDGNHKTIATVKITNPVANHGILDSVFTIGIP